jgi:hypothetical protein
MNPPLLICEIPWGRELQAEACEEILQTCQMRIDAAQGHLNGAHAHIVSTFVRIIQSQRLIARYESLNRALRRELVF